jgi:hypothetical protein
LTFGLECGILLHDMNNEQTSDTTNIQNQEAELRAKRTRKVLLIAVLISYATNMALGAYFMFTKDHANAVTHLMIANMSTLVILDQAYSSK